MSDYLLLGARTYAPIGTTDCRPKHARRTMFAVSDEAGRILGRTKELGVEITTVADEGKFATFKIA